MNTNYLTPTKIIDSNHPDVISYAKKTLGTNCKDPVEGAVKLYYRVRDEIIYNPYIAYHLPETYQASQVLNVKKGHCVCKASLLCALGRASGIPSRLGFATVKNHIATKQLIQSMGTNTFVYHGYTEFYLNNKWVVATPAFDIKTCERHKVPPLEFNGIEDSKYQSFNTDKELFMEYLEPLGTYDDVPLSRIISAFRQTYGDELVNKWIKAFDAMKSYANRRFEKEEAV